MLSKNANISNKFYQDSLKLNTPRYVAFIGEPINRETAQKRRIR